MSLINRVNSLKMAKFGVVKGRSDKELFLPGSANDRLEYGPAVRSTPQNLLGPLIQQLTVVAPI